MPSTIGLGHAAGALGRRTDYLPSEGLRRTETGDLVVPAEMLARSGLDGSVDWLVESGPGGLRLAPDALRKVYVEITSLCNLSCATCIRQTWDEPLGHMPLARFSRLLDGLPGAEGQRSGGVSHPVTLSLSGFGEPLVHPEFLAFVRLARE
jgi:hypothetical protein